MAKLEGKGRFSLGFSDFLDFAEDIETLGGTEALKKAVENALIASKKYAEIDIEKALNASPYSFTAGIKGSKGETKSSLNEVENIPIEWLRDRVAYCYIGVDFSEVPQVAVLMLGDPHHKPDINLRKALQVRGSTRRKVEEVQKAEFEKVLNEVMKQ